MTYYILNQIKKTFSFCARPKFNETTFLTTCTECLNRKTTDKKNPPQTTVLFQHLYHSVFSTVLLQWFKEVNPDYMRCNI